MTDPQIAVIIEAGRELGMPEWWLAKIITLTPEQLRAEAHRLLKEAGLKHDDCVQVVIE